MPMNLTKRFEALYAGPWITGEWLETSLNALASHTDWIDGVVVNLHQVSQAAPLIQQLGLGVAIAPVAYPLGNLPLEIKSLQAGQALEAGAGRLDFLLPVEHLKAGDLEKVEVEIQAMRALAERYQAGLTCLAPLTLLSQDEQLQAATLASANGADLMTATGLGNDTDREALAALRAQAGPDLALVACGRIRLWEQAEDLLEAGATRICTPEVEGIFSGYEVLSQYGLLEA